MATLVIALAQIQRAPLGELTPLAPARAVVEDPDDGALVNETIWNHGAHHCKNHAHERLSEIRPEIERLPRRRFRNCTAASPSRSKNSSLRLQRRPTPERRLPSNGRR